MGVLERDPVATAATLTRWLAEVAGVEDPEVGDVSIPGSTGWSNETVFLTATWGTGSDRRARSLVARIAPSGHQVFPDDTFLRQHAVMRALAERTDVPMPRLRWLETDGSWLGRPFWLMDRVEGSVATDTPSYAAHGWLHDDSPAGQAAVWAAGIDAMARVHRVDLASLDLPDGTLPAAADSVGAHLDHYERFLAWGEDGTPHPLARHALDRLRADRPAEPSEGPALVWGDSRLSNLVVRDRQVVAVLDWEMCGVGDPLQDLGYWLFADEALTAGAGCERLPGFPSAEATAAAWSAATGRSTGALPWYELFAGFRFAVIMLRMGVLLHEMGLVPDTFPRDNLITDGLAAVLARH